MRITLARRVLNGLAEEMRSLTGVVGELRPRFWALYAATMCISFLLAAVGGPTSAVALGGLTLVWGIAALFSGSLAVAVRKRNLVANPSGPGVVPFLPQTLTLLAAPPFLFTQILAFFQIGKHFSGALPVADLKGAVSFGLDNFVHSGLFCDAAEIFDLGFAPVATGLVGQTVVFLSRLLLDLAVLKVIAQLVMASAARARGLGRGEDNFQALTDALAAHDLDTLRYASVSVRDNLRKAVDAACERLADAETHDEAARCLHALQPFASEYLAQLGRVNPEAVREARACLDRPAPPPKRSGLTQALHAGLMALLLALPFVTTGLWRIAFSVSALLATTVLLLTVRSVVARTCRSLPLLALWGVGLVLLQVVLAALLTEAVAARRPGWFAGPEVDTKGAALYAANVLSHSELLADALEIYQIPVGHIEPADAGGRWLTLGLRVLFDVGLIALATAVIGSWYRRRFRRLTLEPAADLLLLEAAREGADEEVRHHHEAIRAFFRTQLRENYGRSIVYDALCKAGFLD